MKEIGGFFELDLPKGEQYHTNALKLNSARNCFKYLLQASKPTKVWLPAYCCDSLIEPLTIENVAYEFYSINKQFDPVLLPELGAGERFLYINYFGLKDKFIKKLIELYAEKLIIDNTQAFFNKPPLNIDTFYSARKFFGVADGGYLYTNKKINNELEYDLSSNNMTHVLGRYELTASDFYKQYRTSESSLVSQPVKKMSKITESLMGIIDYKQAEKKRVENFIYLANALNNVNLIDIESDLSSVPMVYPLLIKENLKNELINNKIYVASYWQDAIKRVDENSVEDNFIKYLIPLPIDQRYSLEDMDRILKVIYSILK